MAHDDRYRERNRGMFGYEGEGFMRGGEAARTPDRGEYNEPGYGRYGGYRGTSGFSNVEADEEYRPSYRGRGPKGYRRSDDRIREDVCERLWYDHDVDASDIEVSVNEATVVLSGSVRDRFEKRRAEDIVESVSGVRDVQNQIRIVRE